MDAVEVLKNTGSWPRNWRFAMNRYILPGGWRMENPHSFLDQFDKWFAFEAFMVGFEDEMP